MDANLLRHDESGDACNVESATKFGDFAMTKLAQLTPLFELTAAELRQQYFAELLNARTATFERGLPAPKDMALAEALCRDYDRAAQRHQLWLARYLESGAAGAT